MKNSNTFSKFKKVLSFVFENRYSNFYRLKYKRAGFNPFTDFNIIDDVKKIPLLTKKEFVETNPSQLLFSSGREARAVFPTFGTTTGQSLITFHSIDRSGGKIFLSQIRQKKILLLAKSFRIPQLYLYLTNLKQTKQGAKHVLAGDISNLPNSCQLASKLKVDHIYATPTLAIMLKKYLVNYPDLQKNLRSLSLAGEVVSKEKRKLLKELYPNKEIFINYGMAEIGGAPAVQCHALTQRKEVLFHLRVDDFYFEIIDPDTEKEVPFGKQGELILTTFQSYTTATPLIRYKTGDMASFRKNDCPCGALGPLLKIYGRINYDIVRAGGFELRSEMLEKSLINLSSFLKNEFEVHIHETFIENKPKIKVALNLSLKKGIKETPELKQKIVNELLENWQLSPRLNLKKAVESGLFEPPQINLVQFPFSAKGRQALILH